VNSEVPPSAERSPAAHADPASILKLISCRVAAEHHAAFGHGQRAWQGLAGCDGFRGQTGGWSLADHDEAVILGFWRDEAAVDAFMSERHDPLFEASRQQPLIQEIQVSRWRRVGLASSQPPLAGIAGRDGGYLRIAEIRLLPNRADHLMQTQGDIWDPAMRAAGVLACGLWRAEAEEARFLSLSLWRSRESEREWRAGPFFDCWRRAGVEDDCEDVTGRLVSVEPDWRVDWSRP